MAATQEQVKAILLVDYDTKRNPDLQAFLDDAALFVADIVTCAATKGLTVSTARQDALQKWIAAHLYKMSDKDMTSSSQQGASASYTGQFGMGFDATRYGQMATRLDNTGCLDNIDKTQEVSLDWLGLRPSEQTPYTERD